MVRAGVQPPGSRLEQETVEEKVKGKTLYFLVEVEPGEVSSVDLNYDIPIRDRLAELGAEYPTKIIRLVTTQSLVAAFRPDPPPPDSPATGWRALHEPDPEARPGDADTRALAVTVSSPEVPATDPRVQQAFDDAVAEAMEES